MAETNESRKITVSREFSVAAPQSERAYPIPASEWEMLKRKISRIAPLQNWYQAGGWLCAGVAITSLISWMASDAPESSRSSTIELAAVICSTLLAIVLLFFDRQQRHSTAETAQNIVEDMSHIEKMFTTEGSPKADASS
jgi:hypothetical protein